MYEQLTMPEEQYPVKPGYMRCIGNTVSYISFKEFNDYDKEYVESLKTAQESNQLQFFCACCPENTLPLNITSNGVMRVKNNGQQELHMESCPKSTHYNTWIQENLKGAKLDETNNKMIFHISLPGVIKSKSTSTSSSSSESSKAPDSKMKLLEMARTLNSIAWEKQTFSKKKEIAIANKEKRTADWSYKSSQDFIRLIYGISNDILIQVGSQIGSLHDICYRKDDFFSCTDFRKRFFIYAEIDKLSPYKPERKYQYITLKAPSNKSPSKLPIRVHTEDYDKLFMHVDMDADTNTTLALAGYINHSIFTGTDKTVNEWATLLKGVVFYTSKNGLFAETPYTAQLIDTLCEKKILFKKPYVPLENYYNTMPTLQIERLRNKDILIDILQEGDTKTLEEHAKWGSDNAEFTCYLLEDGKEEPEDFIARINSTSQENTEE